MAITSNKIMFNMDRAVKRIPVSAMVFLDDFCNNRCSYCNYVRHCTREGEQISVEDFKKLARRLRELGVRGITLSGGGEPTIAKGFDEMAKFLEDEGIPYGINTNFNELHFFKPRYLKVSLDGWDEDSYQAKRGVRHYELVKQNIRDYVAWKEENSPNTSVGIQIVLTDMDEVRRFYEANKDLPVDYISIRPVESTNACWFDDEEHRKMIEEAREYVKKISEADPRVAFSYKWDYIDTRTDKCYAHANQIAVNWRGEVMCCCHRPQDIIGHIMDEDILEKNRNIHVDMSKCDRPCILTSTNEIFEMLHKGCKDSEFL